MNAEDDRRIHFTEKHDRLLKRIFGEDMTLEALKKKCDEIAGFYPEADLLPYVTGAKEDGDDEFLADDIIWLLNDEEWEDWHDELFERDYNTIGQEIEDFRKSKGR